LDTNLWNASYDQQLDPSRLLPALDEYGATPVLGIHVVFELLKTFFSKSPGSKIRAQQLFNHVLAYIDSGLRCVAKDPLECLVAEMYAQKGPDGAEKFIGSGDLSNLTAEITRLASGEVKEEWLRHVQEQACSTAEDRTRFKENLASNVTLRTKLRNISPADVRSWLKNETYSADGRKLLLDYLIGRFPEQDINELTQYSVALLRSGSYSAEALVRAGLYYNWRCAHRSSNPKDLLDDMYHVCNAAYCHIYLSAERQQTEYASNLLQNGTQIYIYERSHPLDEWLCELAHRHRSD
jgi:hypothetical protein